MTTYAAIVASPEVAAARPILAQVASTIADVQVRNRGTIGGNVCSNDPTNHFPPLLAALGAELTIAGPITERTVATDEFFEGVFMTAVHPGELLTDDPHPGQGRRARRLGVRDARQGGHRDRQRRRHASPAAPRALAIGCVAATPVVVTASADETAVRDAVARPPTSTRRPTSTPPPTTAATSPRCCAPRRR